MVDFSAGLVFASVANLRYAPTMQVKGQGRL